MSHTGFVENVTSMRNAAVPQVVLKETKEGYDVRTEAPISDRAILIERVAAITGFTMIALAVTGMYVAKTNAIPGLSAAQMATGATLLTGGIAYLWIAIRGTRHQMNFDLKNRLVHYVVRNHIDGCHILKTMGFDDIESAFVERPAGDGRPAKLHFRLGDGDDRIEVARGTEAEMHALYERLSRDLPPLARASAARARMARAIQDPPMAATA